MSDATSRSRSQRSVRHGQAHGGVQVVSVANEARIGTHAHDDERVPSLVAPEASVPLAARADLLPVVNAFRNVDLELRPRDDATLSTAVGARTLEHLARAATVRAGPLLDELPEDVLRDASHRSGACAGRAPARRRPGLGSRRIAALAREGDVERNDHRRTGERILELDLDDGLHVAAALRPLSTSPASEQVLAEERREDVRDAPEVREALVAAALETGLAVAVVERAALRVGEDLVRLGDVAEAPLGVGFARHVGMKLARERAEGLLDLGVARAALDAEQLVVVRFRQSHVRRLRRRPRRSARARTPPRAPS